MSGVDWDAVKVGDPDPTPAGEIPGDSGCDAQRQWWCTRNSDHDGPHVAGTGAQVLEVWS